VVRAYPQARAAPQATQWRQPTETGLPQAAQEIGPSAPSGRTLAIALGGIGMLAVVVIGTWLLAGQRPGRGASPSASAAAATTRPSATPPATEVPMPGLTLAPTSSPGPTEVPVPTGIPVPTGAASPGIPSIIGDTPAEAVGAFLAQRGVDFAGIRASVDPGTAPAGAYCADLFEEREAVQV
jgi:hypothetical protein